MSGFLVGLPGRALAIYTDTQALLTRWSATLAGRIDAAISSRAPAAGALSDTVWTSAKAGYLDAAVSGRAKFKAVQRGSITIADGAATGTATITSVVVTKALEQHLGSYPANSQGGADPLYWACTVELTNPTTITARRSNSGTTGVVVVRWAVQEWE